MPSDPAKDARLLTRLVEARISGPPESELCPFCVVPITHLDLQAWLDTLELRDFYNRQAMQMECPHCGEAIAVEVDWEPTFYLSNPKGINDADQPTPAA